MDDRSKHAKMGSIKPCNVCGHNAIGVTDDGFRCEEHWITPQHYEGWSTQFTTKHVCRVCGKPASIIEDDGWACDDHRDTELRRLHAGARFTGSARDQLISFAQAHGWSDDVLNDVLSRLPQPSPVRLF